uniref:START domain-containing protein n=1 Tax=Chlorobium chlorochromatii (strain CaD3) TaxID=340177 RepID=Q3ASE7_CHLCH
MSLLEKIHEATCSVRFSNDWLKIFTCPVPSSDFLSFVAVATIDAPQHSVLSLLYDVDVATQWVWKTKEMRVLKELGADGTDGRIVYQLVSAPWPVSDREIISSSTAYMDPNTKEAFIKIECMADYLPKNSKAVRVPEMQGAWNIMPLGENKCRVVFRLHIEPGGEIPFWLANIAVIDTPYHTLVNLREWVKKEKYRTPVDAPFKESAADVIQHYDKFIKE